jgi:hypothetical protein
MGALKGRPSNDDDNGNSKGNGNGNDDGKGKSKNVGRGRSCRDGAQRCCAPTLAEITGWGMGWVLVLAWSKLASALSRSALAWRTAWALVLG